MLFIAVTETGYQSQRWKLQRYFQTCKSLPLLYHQSLWHDSGFLSLVTCSSAFVPCCVLYLETASPNRANNYKPVLESPFDKRCCSVGSLWSRSPSPLTPCRTSSTVLCSTGPIQVLLLLSEPPTSQRPWSSHFISEETKLRQGLGDLCSQADNLIPRSRLRLGHTSTQLLPQHVSESKPARLKPMDKSYRVLQARGKYVPWPLSPRFCLLYFPLWASGLRHTGLTHTWPPQGSLCLCLQLTVHSGDQLFATQWTAAQTSIPPHLLELLLQS